MAFRKHRSWGFLKSTRAPKRNKRWRKSHFCLANQTRFLSLDKQTSLSFFALLVCQSHTLFCLWQLHYRHLEAHWGNVFPASWLKARSCSPWGYSNYLRCRVMWLEVWKACLNPGPYTNSLAIGYVSEFHLEKINGWVSNSYRLPLTGLSELTFFNFSPLSLSLIFFCGVMLSSVFKKKILLNV